MDFPQQSWQRRHLAQRKATRFENTVIHTAWKVSESLWSSLLHSPDVVKQTQKENSVKKGQDTWMDVDCTNTRTQVRTRTKSREDEAQFNAITVTKPKRLLINIFVGMLTPFP